MRCLLAAALLAASSSAQSIPADEWSQAYRNWTYYPDWIIPPSCVDPATCAAPYRNVTGAFSDIFQVWSVSDPYADPAPYPRFVGVYTFFDGQGYQTAWALSDDLVHFTQPLAPQGILYSPRVSWPSQPGEFDYGGAAFVGPLLQNYSVHAPRVLASVAGADSVPRFWYAYFGQDARGVMEPPPGASGLASSTDGLSWKRETPTPFLDTVPAHGAAPWEQTQVYAPYLYLRADGSVADYYNAQAQAAPASPWREQSGIATLASTSLLPGVSNSSTSSWVRDPSNPVIPNGNASSMDNHMASDPKVYYDETLNGGAGAYVMIYFCVGDAAPYNGHASICIAFSLDGVTGWTKASSPLYSYGHHPAGLDACHAHKAWLTADNTGRKYLYYTGDDCKGRGILLLTSTPLP